MSNLREKWSNLKRWQRVGLVTLAALFVIGVWGTTPVEDTKTDTETKKETVAAIEEKPGAKPEEVKEEENKPEVVDKVNAALDAFDEDMKRIMASTGIGGYQGEIEKVEADGKYGVKVTVSTYYDDPGDDGGRNIARKVFSNICLDVPELSDLYVTSSSSGLDSRSVYRSQIPGCKLQ